MVNKKSIVIFFLIGVLILSGFYFIKDVQASLNVGSSSLAISNSPYGSTTWTKNGSTDMFNFTLAFSSDPKILISCVNITVPGNYSDNSTSGNTLATMNVYPAMWSKKSFRITNGTNQPLNWTFLGNQTDLNTSRLFTGSKV